jgi:WAS protein family, member 3
MPLTTRSISPVDLSIHRLPASVQNDELACVANGTLANLIRQLSSLSHHAEQIFTDIHREGL